MNMSEPTYAPGLEGVIAGQTAVSAVTQDSLSYRGYAIEDLAENACFEEVAYLLLYEALPTASELAAFRDRLASVDALPAPLIELLGSIPADAVPMDVVRSAVSVLAHFDPDQNASDLDANRRKAERLIAQIAMVIGARHRLLSGHQPIAPQRDLGHAANLLYMMNGTEPDELPARVMDVSLVLYAEHEFNASTFNARVTVSTLSDLHAALAGGIGTLKGPLHGGANEAAMRMLLEIGDPAKAEAWTRDALASKRKIMGFGHRVYKHGDHRARILKEWAKKLADAVGDTRWTDISQHIEDVMTGEKGIYPNVDFPCASAYYLMGLPIDLYTPLFVASRVTGWSAHVIEQLGNNRLIRPCSEYIGPAPRPFVPIDQR